MEADDTSATQPAHSGPWLSVADVFILIAACAIGLAVGCDPHAARSHVDLLTVFLEIVLPCLFGLIVIGHPAILSWHFISRRRRRPLQWGELFGLVSSASILTIVLVARASAPAEYEEAAGAGPSSAVASLFVVLFTLHAFLAIASATYLASCIKNDAPAVASDLMGVAVAFLPGACVLAFVGAALSF